MSSIANLLARFTIIGWIAVVSLVLVGIPLAVAGEFRTWLVWPLLISAVLMVVRITGTDWCSADLAGPGGSAWFIAAVVIVSGIGLSNIAWSSQHHATNRDPGVYLETGMWLADHGSLLIDGRSGPFLADDHLTSGGLGFTELNDGSARLHSQFPHGTAVVIAAAAQVGGTAAATRVPAAEMALALIMWWFVIARFTSPKWATVAISSMAVDLVTIHFSRDVFSEPLAAAILAGALVVLTTEHGRLKSSTTALAGLAIGLSVGVRIDMIVVVLGLSALAVAAAVMRRPGTVALIISSSVGVAISWADLALRSPEYLADRWSAFEPPLIAAVALGAAALAVSIKNSAQNGPSARSPESRLSAINPRALTAVAATGMVAIVAVSVWALFIRPHGAVQHTGFTAHIAGLQARDSIPVDGTRNYGEQSLKWLVWYLGLPAILLAVAGAAIVWRRLVVTGSTLWLAPGLLLAPMTLLYIQRPRITGDQIWAMRRFVPTAMPLIALLSVTAVAFAVESLRRYRPAVPIAAGLTLSSLILAPPLLVTMPIRSERTMLWTTNSIETLCQSIPPSSAVLVSSQQLLGDHLARSLARICDVPTAVADPTKVDLIDLDRRWKDLGRQLVILAWKGEDVPSASFQSDLGMPQQRLEQTVGRPPGRVEAGTRQLSIWYATNSS